MTSLPAAVNPGELLTRTSRLQPIEAVLRACAVARCTTAISKYGGGRRQCCEAVSLSLFAVRVKNKRRGHCISYYLPYCRGINDANLASSVFNMVLSPRE